MIRFKSVTLRNYKSFGNSPTTFTFHEKELARIRGANGMGKSTIMEALFFCLYNKSMTGVNKDELINSINNKALEVFVTFYKGDTKYVIERGVKPNYLRLYIDGEEQEKAANVRDDQRIVEEILEMNANTFRNTVVMSEADSKFFMEMTPAERREIVEELLNIRQFSVMSDILKVWTTVIKSDLKDTGVKSSAQELVVVGAKENLNKIKVLAAAEKDHRASREKELRDELDFTKARQIDGEKMVIGYKTIIEDLPTADVLIAAEGDTNDELQKKNKIIDGCNEELMTKEVRFAEVKRDAAHMLERERSLKEAVETATEELESVKVSVDRLRKELGGRVDNSALTEQIEQIDVEVESIRRQNIVYWETQMAEAKRFEELIAGGKCPTCQREACADDFVFADERRCQEELDAFEAKIKELREERERKQEDKSSTIQIQLNFDRRVEVFVDKKSLLSAAETAQKDFNDMAAVLASPKEIEGDIKRLRDEMADTVESRDKFVVRLDKVREMIKSLEDATKTLELAEINMRQFERYIESNEEKLRNLGDEALIDIEGEEDIVKDTVKVLEDLKTEVDEYSHTLEYYGLIKKVLSDDGIKAHIVDIYIPFLNERINHFLVELDAYYDFHFTSTFDVEIKSRFRDKFKYESFSSGQKSRINIAIMLAFVDLAAAKSTIITNLMFLDELLDSHLDDQGCDDILRVLRRKANDESKAINIISHKSGLVEGFDREYLAQIEDNFTQLREVN